MMTKLYDLAFEVAGDTAELEQDAGCGEVHRVTLHRVHVQHLAGLMGLIGTSDPATAHTLMKLERRLRVLHERCKYLAQWLNLHSDSEHADLSFEQAYSEATADIADEFVADLSASDADTLRIGNGASVTSALPAPADADSTTVANPQQTHSKQGGKPIAIAKSTAQLSLEASPC